MREGFSSRVKDVKEQDSQKYVPLDEREKKEEQQHEKKKNDDNPKKRNSYFLEESLIKEIKNIAKNQGLNNGEVIAIAVRSHFADIIEIEKKLDIERQKMIDTK